MTTWYLVILATTAAAALAGGTAAFQCGEQANGALCPNNACCSRWGWCGNTDDFCGAGCQSQCRPPPPPAPPGPPPPPRPPFPPSPVSEVIDEALFNRMLLHRATPPCPGGFYTYQAFLDAAARFPEFGNTGDDETRKQEVAAFFGQTSHETTGGWPGAPDGQFSWGYCFIEEVGANAPGGASYCVESNEWPCVSGRKYFGRGPIQLSYNYNYGPAGRELGLHLLQDPDLVAKDPVASFETALWFWMTPQPPKPSCHAVITGRWTPSASDIAAGRTPGYGMLTNIINGGLECGGPGPDSRVESRINFYKRYCDILGVGYGERLDCYRMHPYGLTSAEM